MSYFVAANVPTALGVPAVRFEVTHLNLELKSGLVILTLAGFASMAKEVTEPIVNVSYKFDTKKHFEDDHDMHRTLSEYVIKCALLAMITEDPFKGGTLYWRDEAGDVEAV